MLRDSAWYCVAPRLVKVTQIIDKDSVLIEYDHYYHKVCWLEGCSTTGLVDGDTVIGVACLLEVSGTKQYKTALGATNTVLVLKPFGLAPILPQSRPGAKRPARPRGPKQPASRKAARMWTDSSGKHKVLAVFVSVDDGEVKLRKVDGGAVISVPLTRLSKEDQELVSGWAGPRVGPGPD